MSLPLFEEFTEGQRKQFGPQQTREVLTTRGHAYHSPFMFENVSVGNFYEIDPTKGVELKSLDGFITIEEDHPISAVTVVGSGCVPQGFNVVEWWDEGDSIDNMKNQLVKPAVGQPQRHPPEYLFAIDDGDVSRADLQARDQRRYEGCGGRAEAAKR